MSFNIVTSRSAPQVIIDQATLEQLHAELGRRIGDLERLRAAIETLSAINDAERFQGAAMAMVNQLASRWQAERVSLGFLKGRYVRLSALSHTEKFTRQMKLVLDIEAAMEECLDQDIEVVFPPLPNAAYVSRSTETLATRHGPSTVLALPLRRKNEVQAVLMIERKGDKLFKNEEIETLRLTADLLTARIVNLHDQDKWVGAKALDGTKKLCALAVGPKHTWAKVAVLAVLATTLTLAIGRGQWSVGGDTTLQAEEKQIVCAPFEGQLRTVHVQTGDLVVSKDTELYFANLGECFGPLPNPLAINCLDSTLATFDTLELGKQVTQARQEYITAVTQARIAEAAGKTAERDEKLANSRRVQQQIQLLEDRIEKARVTSPVDGIVLSGDLKQYMGRMMKQGDTLFEVGQLEYLRGEIQVPEDDIGYVKVGEKGQLWFLSYPGQSVDFVVERINPVAESVKDKNVYKVRVKLASGQLQPWMRPGMEGQAKVHAGHASWGWQYSRKAYNWARMQIWMWL